MKKLTAAKEHKCSKCQGTINKGDTYWQCQDHPLRDRSRGFPVKLKLCKACSGRDEKPQGKYHQIRVVGWIEVFAKDVDAAHEEVDKMMRNGMKVSDMTWKSISTSQDGKLPELLKELNGIAKQLESLKRRLPS